MPIIDMDKVGEALNTKADIDLNNTGVFSTSSGGVNLVQSTPSEAKGKEVASADFTLKQGGLELMDVVFAPLGIDESKNKRRYLNGQVIIQSQFPAFTAAVKARMTTMTNAFTTEVNWQAEKTNSKLGQCGKFVVDDTAGTIRLPCVVNAQGLVDLALIGGIKSESLPNIKGTVGGTNRTDTGETTNGFKDFTGAFYNSGDVTDKVCATAEGTTFPTNGLGFNASRSSASYQDGAPVSQEAVQYPYCIVVNTGVDEADRPINNYQVNNVYSYGMSQYYKGDMNNNSWLKSAGQWNDGTVYTGMYQWLIEQMNAGVSGFVATTSTYTDYDFVINTTDQTFRLPLLSNRVLVEKKEPTDSDSTWYNLYSDGWLEQGGVLEASNQETVSFVKSYTTAPNVMITARSVSTGGASSTVMTTSISLTSFYTISGGWAENGNFTLAGGVAPKVWSAQGYTNIPQNTAWSLYYYIGDTLQNAQLINVARIEETVVNKTNKVQAAEASMPSGKYIDLTLGASGTTYIAPANGWFVLDKAATAANQYAALYNTGNGTTTSTLKSIAQTVIPVASNLGLTIPALKGDIVHLDYTLAGDTMVWRFVYAQGDQ